MVMEDKTTSWFDIKDKYEMWQIQIFLAYWVATFDVVEYDFMDLTMLVTFL